MKKIFSINKTDNYTILLFGYCLFQMCDHYLISFSLDRFPVGFSEDLFDCEKINDENIHYLQYTDFSYKKMCKYNADKSGLSEGFVFFTKETHELVGYVWVMYKGGNEDQYRIRKIDAFGFDFCVLKNFRGNRYIEYFIYVLLKHLETKGIRKLYASVRKNNASALKAYERAGMKIEANKKFYRFIKLRIPYPIL